MVVTHVTCGVKVDQPSDARHHEAHHGRETVQHKAEGSREISHDHPVKNLLVKVGTYRQGHELKETPDREKESACDGQAGDPIDHVPGKLFPQENPADPVKEESQKGQERDPNEIGPSYSSDVNRVFHSITISSH
jgi:hypothetical protein